MKKTLIERLSKTQGALAASLLSLLLSLTSLPALAATSAEATTDEFRLSIKHDGVRSSAGEETLRYSPLWDGGSNETAKVTLKQGDAVLSENLTVEGDYAWSVSANGTYNLTHTTYTNGAVAKVLNATFVVTGKDQPFPPGSVTATGWNGKFDGNGHGITVTTTDIENQSITYSRTEAGPYTETNPLFTNVCNETVWYVVAAPGYITETNSATVVIAQGDIGGDGDEPGGGEIPEGGLSKYDATYVYDGEGHTINTQALFAVTLAGATPSFSFSLTENGTYQPDPMIYTNVGEYVIWYQITAPNYAPYKHQAKLTITTPVHEHDGIVFDKIIYPDFKGGRLSSGRYFLVSNISLDRPIVFEGDASLCFNGYLIQGSSTWGIELSCLSDRTLTFHECNRCKHRYSVNDEGVWFLNEEEGEKILEGGGITGFGTAINGDGYDQSTVEFYGGNVVGNNYAGIQHWGDVNIHGGSVVGNKVYGVYAASWTIDGGSVSCNKYGLSNGAAGHIRPCIIGGGSISNNELGVTMLACYLNITNDAEVTDIIALDYAREIGDDQYPNTVIDFGDAVKGTRKYRVKTLRKPTATTAIAVTKYTSRDCSLFIQSADENLSVINIVNSEGQCVGLVEKNVDPPVVNRLKSSQGVYGEKSEVSVEASASVGSVIGYQWYECEDGVNPSLCVEGETNSVYKIGEVLNAGNYPYKCVLSAKSQLSGFISVVTSDVAVVEVYRRSITLTSASDSKKYDGEALTNHTVTVGGLDWAPNEGATYDVTGSQTVVGSSANAFGYTLNENTKESNYAITKVEGTLEVTNGTVDPTVVDPVDPDPGDPSKPYSSYDTTYVYDGEGHTINTQALFAVTLPGATPSFSFVADVGGRPSAVSLGSAVPGGQPLPADGAAWSKDAPAYTNSGEYVVWYRITAPNYSDYIHAAKVTITNIPLVVKSISARQRYPWNGMVDIDYELVGSEVHQSYRLIFSATDMTGGVPIGVESVTPKVVAKPIGRVVWDMAADCPPNFKSENVKLDVRAEKEVK